MPHIAKLLLVLLLVLISPLRLGAAEHELTAPDITIVENIPDRWQHVATEAATNGSGHLLSFKDRKKQSNLLLFIGNRAAWPDTKYVAWQAGVYQLVRRKYFGKFVPHLVEETRYVVDDADGVHWGAYGMWLRAEHQDRFIGVAAPAVAQLNWWIAAVLVNTDTPIDHGPAMKAVVNAISVKTR